MPKHVALCLAVFVGSIGFKMGANYPTTQNAIIPVAGIVPVQVPKEKKTQFELLECGEECIVDLYSDHSGIYQMKIISKVSPDKILVQDNAKKMMFVKLSQIVPKSGT